MGKNYLNGKEKYISLKNKFFNIYIYIQKLKKDVKEKYTIDV